MKLGYKPNALLSAFGEKITYKGQSIKASVEIGEYDGKGSGFVDKALADKAQIWVRGKITHLGYFDDPEQGHQAYLCAKRRLHEGCTI